MYPATPSRLLAYLSAHGNAAQVNADGTLTVFVPYCAGSNGRIVSTVEPETIPATWGAVRAILGY